MGPGQFFSSGMWIIPQVMMKRSFFGNSSSGSSNETKSGESALDILKKRYARGEISKTEFEDMKKNI